MKPYETAAGRIAALYRVPTAPKPERTLEISCGRAPLRLAFATAACVLGAAPLAPGDVAHQNDYHVPLPFAPASFERVILHQTLDDVAMLAPRGQEHIAVSTFLSNIATLLAPSGLLVGCISNRYNPKNAWQRVTRRWTNSGHNSASMARHSPPACASLLAQAGLTQVRVFSLLPNCDSPLRLVDIDPATSKFAFRYELSARRELSPAARLVRRIAIELGLYPYLEESIFFWGYKPC